MAILLKLSGGNSHSEDDEFSDFLHISFAFFFSVVMTILLKLIGGNNHREDDAGADDDGEVETQEESIVDPRHELPRHFLVVVPVRLHGPHVRLDAWGTDMAEVSLVRGRRGFVVEAIQTILLLLVVIVDRCNAPWRLFLGALQPHDRVADAAELDLPGRDGSVGAAVKDVEGVDGEHHRHPGQRQHHGDVDACEKNQPDRFWAVRIKKSAALLCVCVCVCVCVSVCVTVCVGGGGEGGGGMSVYIVTVCVVICL